MSIIVHHFIFFGHPRVPHDRNDMPWPKMMEISPAKSLELWSLRRVSCSSPRSPRNSIWPWKIPAAFTDLAVPCLVSTEQRRKNFCMLIRDAGARRPTPAKSRPQPAMSRRSRVQLSHEMILNGCSIHTKLIIQSDPKLAWLMYHSCWFGDPPCETFKLLEPIANQQLVPSLLANQPWRKCTLHGGCIEVDAQTETNQRLLCPWNR